MGQHKAGTCQGFFAEFEPRRKVWPWTQITPYDHNVPSNPDHFFTCTLTYIRRFNTIAP